MRCGVTERPTDRVYRPFADGKRQLWLRSLDSLNAHPLPGTEEPLHRSGHPTADRWFQHQGKLKRIEIAASPTDARDAPRLTVERGERPASSCSVRLRQGTAPGAVTRGATTPAMHDISAAKGISSPSFLPDGVISLQRRSARVGGSLDSLDSAPVDGRSDARYQIRLAALQARRIALAQISTPCTRR